MPKYDALPEYRNPTLEEVSKVENYLKDYVKQSKITPLYLNSVEIPFTDFFDYKIDFCKNNAPKFHLTTIEDERGNLKHCFQLDNEFKKKVEQYKKNGFQNTIGNTTCLLTDVPRSFSHFTMKEMKSPSTRKRFAEHIFTRMNRMYVNEEHKMHELRIKLEKNHEVVL